MKRVRVFYFTFAFLLIVLLSADIIWAQPEEATFNYTGGQQSFVVPQGVTSVHIQAWGAQGSDTATGQDSAIGGLGGFAEGDLPVTAGQTLEIFVGGQGTSITGDTFGGGGFNGGGNAYGLSSFVRGGGGGASDVRVGGATLNDRVIVAAGGGGSCVFNLSFGGVGGGLTGGNGGDEPGFGGTQNAGGLGFGNPNLCLSGDFGVGGDSSLGAACGGGGGGWYGGGSGCGAGGGSSYIDGVENGSTTPGVRDGDGLIILTYIIERNVPTLSEWGMIAMAAILGIMAIMVIRRRQVTA